ncbi:hypothetical protein VHEMI01168 [[Torrubiella] hemipterigena]|uniref:Zn(2)-C6 fungal-type domain-containing protein n=1 Tax=[Torrubiella] hemipterigena TaxID=1531966 RepID=A0A0A1SSD2_9HYPO|nr:hypothetical protein VHEMI01168 [[Torrubiella] hemipterigena]
MAGEEPPQPQQQRPASAVTPPTSPTDTQSSGSPPKTASPTIKTDEQDAPAPPVKRGRRSNPKVKTGCANCKLRRIKCDEKRPECSQCVKSRKVCSGYPVPSRRDGPIPDVPIAPRPMLASRPQPAPLLAPAADPRGGASLLRNPVVLPPRRPNHRRRMQELAAQRRQKQDQLRVIPSPAVVQPASTLALNPHDAQYFDLFRIQTAAQLSGYFNSNFWTQRVLQGCHAEPAIRHAVVALGALYKTLELSTDPVTPTDGAITQYNHVMMHWQVAVKQYSEACKAIVSLSGDTISQHRTRLMAIILLACFDSFIGDHKQGIVQIQTGLGILQKIKTMHSARPGEGAIEEDLVMLFTRLAIQAKSYDMAFHFPPPYVIMLSSSHAGGEPSSPVSDHSAPDESASQPPNRPFESLFEARSVSDELCKALLTFIEKLQLAKSDPSYVLPAAWKIYGIGLKDRLSAWAEAYEPIFSSRFDPRISHLERSGIAALKMFQINTNILFLMMFCDNEVQFDSFMPHFKTIVDLGWEVVGEDERRAAAAGHSTTKGGFRSGKYAPSHLKPSFAADLGIVPPLFVVATKCRDPRLRRQAIQLLRSSARREGMWDSELTAKIGEWCMQVEEYDALNPMGATIGPGGEYVFAGADGVLQKTIPEERRIMVKSVDFDLRARYADVKLGTRAVGRGGQDVREKFTRITW